MNTGVFSKRYAKALLDFAIKRGNEKQVYNEVYTLARHLAEISDLRKTIDNPVLTKNVKLNLLIEAAGGQNVSEEMKRFLSLVLDAKREKFLQFISWSFIDQYRERKSILIGKLTTAVESPELIKHLENVASKRTHSHVEIKSEIDPSIIGGFIMELGGYRLDASIDTQLKKVKRQFVEKNRRIV